MKRSTRIKPRGQDLVEFAITIPILMAIALGIFDLGRVVYFYSALQNATREGARYAIIHPCATDYDTIIGIVKNRALGMDPDIINVNVIPGPEGSIEVSASVNLSPYTLIIAPFFPNQPDPNDPSQNFITLRTRSIMQIEGVICGS